MRINTNYQFKTKKGITLIALVVTIIVLLILAGISIQMLTGDNGILKRASEAKERTGISQVLEEVKLVATEGMSNYYLKDEENIVSAVENAISTKVSGFKEFTSTRGTSPIQGIVTRNGKDYAFSVDANSGEVTSPEKSDYQWRIVSDNDNDGVISTGDEVAPLIDSIKDEHFYVISNNGQYVELLSKLPVDYNTNSQNSSASLVSFNMVYCDLEGVEHDWIMPAGAEGLEYYTYDSLGNLITEHGYYDGTETGKVHCTGTYAINYGNRLTQAGLQLIECDNSGYPFVRLPKKSDGDSTGSPEMFDLYFGLSNYWNYDLSENFDKVDKSNRWYDTHTFKPVIQIDINLINTSIN